jgi:photosystem II stability/assembly factor-like uncharacterized protein
VTEVLSRRTWGLRALSVAASAAGALPASGRAHDGDATTAHRRLRALERPALAARRPTQCVLLTVARAGSRLIAAGERGLVIVSDDAGRSWRQAQVPVSATLTALRFAGEREGWAAGNMGVVLHTGDGGATWRKVLDGRKAADLALATARALHQTSLAGQHAAEAVTQLEDAQRLAAEGPDKPFLDIAVRSDGSVIAVGAYGLAFGSRDHGRSWTPLMQHLPNPDGLSYYGLAQRGGEQFLFGEQGLLLRAEAGAERFAEQESPSSGSLFAAVALREGPLLLMGLRGKVFRSAERGAPWTPLATPVDASLFSGTQLEDGRVVLVGAAGQVLVSRDLGQRFAPVALPVRFPFADVAVAPDGALLLVGQRGLLRVEAATLDAAFDNTGAQARAPQGVAATAPAARTSTP